MTRMTVSDQDNPLWPPAFESKAAALLKSMLLSCHAQSSWGCCRNSCCGQLGSWQFHALHSITGRPVVVTSHASG